ncbi:MAG TPA: PAS domain-containing protein [Dehalococcoidia bacterium]|nr:PAS domain-containing protein [Dehalococcoidia bacterium]
MLQAILDNTTAIVFVKDLQGRYVLVNRRYAELRGTDRDAMIGKTVYDFMPREQADLVHSHDDEVALAGAPREWEEQFTRDGESVTYLSARFPLRDGEGRPYAVCGMLTDISERKQAELEMAAELTGLRALVETSPVGVVVAEAEGDRVVTVNREAERILGIPHRPGWGMPQYQALFVRRHPDGRPFAEDEYPMFRALHQGETVRLEEVVYEFNDGRLVRALVNATPVYGDAGDILAAIATLQEIAEPQAPAALETPAEAKPAQTVDVDLGGQPVHLDYGVISERGQRRETNEDAVYCEPAGSQRVQDDGWLCAVADGMGGAAVGEVASKLAVETLVSSYYASLGGSGDLAAAMGRANGVIYETAQQNPRYGGMGTTLTAALIRDGRLTVAHVGDTRTYLVRDWGIRQLTSDHTWVAELVRAGALDPNHRKSLPISSVLTRTLGRDASTEVDLVEVELMPGDRVVLCSDGLSNTVDDWEIARTAAAEAPQAAARSLVGLARERGGGDDTTVVIVKLG